MRECEFVESPRRLRGATTGRKDARPLLFLHGVSRNWRTFYALDDRTVGLAFTLQEANNTVSAFALPVFHTRQAKPDCLGSAHIIFLFALLKKKCVGALAHFTRLRHRL